MTILIIYWRFLFRALHESVVCVIEYRVRESECKVTSLGTYDTWTRLTRSAICNMQYAICNMHSPNLSLLIDYFDVASWYHIYLTYLTYLGR